MVDRREKILRSILPPDQIWEEARHVDNVPFDNIFNAMDENGKQMCMELLEYMANKKIVCGAYSSPDGFLFSTGGKILTKEQLFEEFL